MITKSNVFLDPIIYFGMNPQVMMMMMRMIRMMMMRRMMLRMRVLMKIQSTQKNLKLRLVFT